MFLNMSVKSACTQAEVREVWEGELKKHNFTWELLPLDPYCIEATLKHTVMLSCLSRCALAWSARVVLAWRVSNCRSPW